MSELTPAQQSFLSFANRMSLETFRRAHRQWRDALAVLEGRCEAAEVRLQEEFAALEHLQLQYAALERKRDAQRCFLEAVEVALADREAMEAENG